MGLGNRSLLSFFFVMAALVGPGSWADAKDSTQEFAKEFNPTQFYVPVGFDDNDEIVVVADGYLPDPCYKLRNPEFQVDSVNKVITVQPKAAHVTGVCPDVLVPYSSVVRMPSLPMGDYTIRTKDGKKTAQLKVNHTNNPGPDDHLYAPVDSAQVVWDSEGKLSVILSGRITNNCLTFRGEPKIEYHGSTIVVLPILEKTDRTPKGADCDLEETQFQKKVPIADLMPGRYLLHVRSLNGQSINEVFSNTWKKGDPK